MAETANGVTIGDLTQTSTMSPTDLLEIERGGQAYAITYESLIVQLEDSLGIAVIVKTCSDIFYTIGQKKSPMPSAKIRNYSHSHNLVSQ